MGKRRTPRTTKTDEQRIAHKPSTPKAAKATKSATVEAVKAPTEKRKGVKRLIAEILQAGANLTVEELMEATNAKTEVTVRTALSDLKSPTYCGLDRPLPIVAHEGRYRLLTENEIERVGQQMDSHNKAAKELPQ